MIQDLTDLKKKKVKTMAYPKWQYVFVFLWEHKIQILRGMFEVLLTFLAVISIYLLFYLFMIVDFEKATSEIKRKYFNDNIKQERTYNKANDLTNK